MKKTKTAFFIKTKDLENQQYLYFNKEKGFVYGDTEATAFKNTKQIDKNLPLIKKVYSQMTEENPKKYDILEVDKYVFTSENTLSFKKQSTVWTNFYYPKLYEDK